MALFYSEAKKVLKKYAGIAGTCSPEELDLFVKKVLQYMLYSGEYGNEKKFCFHAIDGCFTLPYELEVPLKVKIDGKVGQVWSRWFEYHSGVNLDGCVPAQESLYEEPNRFPTVYELPQEGGYVVTLGTCIEDTTSHVIIRGQDLTGREIYTTHKGEKIRGEYLSIVKGKAIRTQVKFGKITEVYKTETNGYVNLLWANDELDGGFLADYEPWETSPQYRRVRIIANKCNGVHQVSVLGRIRLKQKYTDKDLIPFDNLYALELAAQAVNASRNDNPEKAIVKDNQLQQLLERENSYKRVTNGQPIDFFMGTSAGKATNNLLRPRRGIFYRRNR